MTRSNIKARRAQVDVSQAEQVGKHNKERVEIWSKRPRIVAATAAPRAIMCRIKA
jgi:hypothetical protein